MSARLLATQLQKNQLKQDRNNKENVVSNEGRCIYCAVVGMAKERVCPAHDSKKWMWTVSWWSLCFGSTLRLQVVVNVQAGIRSCNRGRKSITDYDSKRAASVSFNRTRYLCEIMGSRTLNYITIGEETNVNTEIKEGTNEDDECKRVTRFQDENTARNSILE